MIEVSVCLSDCLSVTQLNSASLSKKTAERIKMLLAVNTLGGPRDIVLHGGPDTSTNRGKETYFYILGPPAPISPERLKIDLKFCVHIEGWGP